MKKSEVVLSDDLIQNIAEIKQKKLNHLNLYAKIDAIAALENHFILNKNIVDLKVKNPFVDLIVTSPPYNVDIQYNSNDDKMDYSQYLKFTEEWLHKCYQFSVDGGRLCLNIPLDKNKGGMQIGRAHV